MEWKGKYIDMNNRTLGNKLNYLQTVYYYFWGYLELNVLFSILVFYHLNELVNKSTF